MNSGEISIVFSGGGTGGHIYPAVAVADYLKKRYNNLNIVFIGTNEGLESKIVPQHGYKIEYIQAKGLKRSLTVKNVEVFLKFISGYRQALQILKRIKPKVVFVTGGYVSLPVALAARRLKIKTILHEQNAYPGLANKIISRFCEKILISFEESKRFFKNSNKVVLTGNPVRLEIFSHNERAAKSSLGLEDKIIVLAVGGSRGAENLNKAVIRLSKEFEGCKDVYFILSSGDTKYLEAVNFANSLGVKSNIKILPYISDMPRYLAAADIVISRAGAIAISEITALGKPSIIVPSPYVANNHQEYNAKALEKVGACFVVLESELESDKLKSFLEKLIYDKALYERMSESSKKMGKPEATQNIGKIFEEYLSL
ncbi:UDP-N-acetylglucosamine--N-acetylmuramyl-(pentapeptide) pyrophosphoryl-undecaprenol N-acetylglucosamine transferase [Caldicellulosiruptor saccharolyticus DSM 8903]|uniref:UDP-N-acetylglucosamine--N-acetylmuramyl-(pentapeptide) pyrophosphoryl-undecaprenol N-acetylglucosamine transferase n=1 Tax=Caldicellulosiruptor saccharolyticus (strain ATCC 43494 / DSM 8903 / Tp8T 6331) TaxID=351627 RepID=MURG_CALS8|nr:undecaprenyldiphospho-muramoylpentapeptide beta-N-acetylglucosaminyltransferase [Caldicellulosiruptor saccharolyticus]A4XI04.1 RecName: Full=UDP-N-acetylglucosamine--N-acetylmuramyl-(pentapeptide) pyrophosphoryl-undecaprenol N-acetylglucosamine transferase; AltName: Full=Undecaprenyl-PP-MurNAc-pentapeptide-UDPGlcNAc GlcNAc transferase [Caldicellulosiruptor saccharolyticus DSM 8903]ABP66539.1 UDP-N-acetylglucosamine--N-acetylmuramyl-(pentapeptide) pyrophosphoryl-undecaprenol N-acetylglucosamine